LCNATSSGDSTGNQRPKQWKTPHPTAHVGIEREWIDLPTTPNRQVIENLDAAPEDTLTVELHHLLLLVQQTNDFRQLSRLNEDVDILNGAAIAVEVGSGASAYRPRKMIRIEGALHDAKIACNERHKRYLVNTITPTRFS
jgi:hypothetical protein